MAYNEDLARRIRTTLQEFPGFTEKKMFGGIGFMLNGNMACGVNGDDLIIRVGSEKYDEALIQSNTKVFDFTGRPIKGWIMVEPEGYKEEHDFKNWIQLGIDFASALPPK